MADIPVKIYRTKTVREGTSPTNPSFPADQEPIIENPEGTSDFVPYVDANKNVQLGEFGLSTGFVKYDTTPTNIPEEQGTSYWDVDDETVAIVMNGITQKVGEDQFLPVKNMTGATIPKGSAVGYAGTIGSSGRVLISLFLANGANPSKLFLGVTGEAIPTGGDSKVYTFGRLKGINTSAFTANQVLYCSPSVAGGFTATVPTSPSNIISVAVVINSSATVGSIFIRPQIGSDINEDEGVRIISPLDGQALVYDSVLGLWVNGGGRDVNAVHYDAADSKSGTEKQQARINIGSTSATPQIIATSGAINDLVITSNNLVFTGSTVVLSGIVAGLYGEEITILNLTGGNITIVHASISLANNQFFMGSTLILGSNDVILLKYRSGAPGYWYLSSTNTFIRKNQGLAFVEVINSKFGINKGFVGGAGSLLIAPTTGSSRNIDIYNLSGVLTGWWDSGGSIFHTRSSSSTQSLRRDEQRLHYLNSITTIGSINDQALTDGIFNYRFTACTNLTGISNGEIGKRITIQNDSDSNLVMEHQDVLSLANNRLNLIGGASITIPTKGKMDIEYCTGNRWELVSKNF